MKKVITNTETKQIQIVMINEKMKLGYEVLHSIRYSDNEYQSKLEWMQTKCNKLNNN